MGLEQKIRSGAAWMVLYKVADRGLMLVSTVILARLLMPADFGLVAMASVLVALMELVRAVGFDMALIQNQSAERKHYDTAWTFTVLCGAISAAGLLLLSIPFSYLYSEPRLIGVLAVMSLGSLIGGLENIGVVAFRKELSFDQEFRFLMAKRLVEFLTTVGLALLLRNFWALVLGLVAGRIASVVISYLVHPYRPRLSLAGWHELFHFSKWLFLNGVTSYIQRSAAHFVLGGLGARSLGLFSMSDRISRLPLTDVVVPINSAIFPGYARLSSARDRFRTGFLKVISAMAVFALPAGIGIAATAELLVSAILGDNWIEAVPLIKALALCGAISTLSSNTYFIFVAVGRVRSFCLLSVIYALILLPMLIVFSIHSGAIGAATAHLLAAAFCLPLSFWAVSRILHLSWRELAANLWRPVTASTAMYFIVRHGMSLLAGHSAISDPFQLIGLILLGAVSYCLILLALWQLSGRPDGPERMALATSGCYVRRLLDLQPV